MFLASLILKDKNFKVLKKLETLPKITTKHTLNSSLHAICFVNVKGSFLVFSHSARSV